VRDATEGATKAGLEFAAERISEWISKFKNKELAFIQDKETILAVRRERESAEWKLISQFLKDPPLRIQVQVGFVFRELQKNKEKLGEARARIIATYGTDGLHVAELAQLGILGELLARLTSLMGSSVQDVSKSLTSFLENSKSLAIFVTAESSVRLIVRKAETRLESLEPHLLIFFAKGFARSVLKKVLAQLRRDGYYVESEFSGEQLTAFVYTPEARKRFVHWADFLATG
jgi:hypothetical protein